jgi:tetratricopeptide (TPR) repeat protein
MKTTIFILIASILLLGSTLAGAKPLEEYIQEAQKHQQSGYIRESVKTMEEAVAEHPQSSDAHAYLGLYLGMSAGKTNDMTETMSFIETSFATLDKAVALLNVPDFFGKSEAGIEDLEFAVKTGRGKLSVEQMVTAYYLLGKTYQKKGALDKARNAWEEIIESAPGTELAKNAEESINQLARNAEEKKQLEAQKPPDSAAAKALRDEIEKHPGNIDVLLQLGKVYSDEGKYDEAEGTLKEAIGIDPTSVDAHKLLAMTLIGKVSGGYDQKIYENTDYRSNIAFELTRVLDAAVALAPDDIELRLWRGIMGVEMPFFVGKLDQGIEDLNRVVQSDAPDSTKAEALYGLGVAYRKKTTTSWIEVVSKHSDSPAAQLVFDSENPEVKRFHISKHKLPVLVIDFVLGFRDELEPQTVVWIEDEDGNFVKTLYVSGFSGYAKEKQINLPIWSSSSNFVDCDGVTGASIDLGHHIYVWDLKDHSGNRVKSGKYFVKVEVSYWPSMQYQLAETTLNLGQKEENTIVEQGNFIPYLEVTYYPK